MTAFTPLLALVLGALHEPAADTVIAIRNITVITATSSLDAQPKCPLSALRRGGQGERPQAEGPEQQVAPPCTVVIRDGVIAMVGPAAEVAIPEGARVIEGAGRYLIPGLIEMHAHLSKTRASALGLFIAHGVTTLRDMGGDHQELLGWRREVRAGDRLGPRILMAGPYLESLRNVERMRRDPPEARVEPFERTRIPVGSPGDARRIVDSLARLELDFLKIRTVQDRATYRALNEAAAAHGLALVGHAPLGTVESVVEAGQDGVEHFFYPTLDSLSREERMIRWRDLAKRGVTVVPTLVTLTRATLTPLDRLRAVVADSAGRVEPLRPYLSRFLILDWREQLLEVEAGAERRPLFQRLYHSTMRNLREMHAAGVQLLAGSDVAVLNIFPGASLHDELVLFVDVLDMTPAEALERATRRSAEFLGVADSVGTVEAGKVADLVLLDADPLANIANSRRIAAVVLRGAVYDRPALDSVLAAVRAAPDIHENDWRRAPH